MRRASFVVSRVLVAAVACLVTLGCTGFVQQEALRSLGSFAVGVFGEVVDETLTPNRD